MTVVGGTTPADHDGWMWDLTVPGNNDHDFYVVVDAGSGVAVLVHNSDGCVTVSDGVMGHIFGQHGWGGAYHETALTAEDPAMADQAMGNVFARGISKEDLQGMIQEAIADGTKVPRAAGDTREGYYIDYDFGGYEQVGANGQNGMRLAVNGTGNLESAMPIWMTGGAG